MAKAKVKFICQTCGYESPKWMGKCPGCGEWNTMTEEVLKSGSPRRAVFAHSNQTVQNPRRSQQLKQPKNQEYLQTLKNLTVYSEVVL